VLVLRHAPSVVSAEGWTVADRQQCRTGVTIPLTDATAAAATAAATDRHTMNRPIYVAKYLALLLPALCNDRR